MFGRVAGATDWADATSAGRPGAAGPDQMHAPSSAMSLVLRITPALPARGIVFMPASQPDGSYLDPFRRALSQDADCAVQRAKSPPRRTTRFARSPFRTVPSEGTATAGSRSAHRSRACGQGSRDDGKRIWISRRHPVFDGFLMAHFPPMMTARALPGERFSEMQERIVAIDGRLILAQEYPQA